MPVRDWFRRRDVLVIDRSQGRDVEVTEVTVHIQDLYIVGLAGLSTF